jgi:hypothetical protein
MTTMTEPIDIRLPAHRAPGSASSDESAELLERLGKAKRERRRVLLWFAAQSQPRTRHECADVLYPVSGGLGSACGRINDLVTLKWLEEVGKQGKRATLQITSRGRQMAKLWVRAAA